MPVEVESTSQFEDLTNILKKRTWWILVPLALIGTLGTSFAVLVPKKYVAKTRIMLAGAESEEARAGTLFILRSVLRESGEYSLLIG